ncbi:MAG: N-acetylglucosamine kinase [Cyclobacteriaceae bacterium]|nr:N-acetylglucosamine kinase [Cyclobacteriaceae bacterium]
MIIIADSGGSKIDWRLLSSNGRIAEAHSTGFNPYYQPVTDLHKSLKSVLLPLVDERVDRVFFYGAGVSSEKNQDVVKGAFLAYFPDAQVEIGWDLLAAARALCGREPGIACIMGTGSNSCLYDGEKIVEVVANLGWILADEGSGTYIGKKFIFDYLRKLMPESLATAFHEQYPWSREEILEKVYKEEKPSAFLASFTRFVGKHMDDSYCHDLVYNSFADFYEQTVMRYPNYQELSVHFTGSISFHFSSILRQVGIDKGINVKNIMEGPIAGLVEYHRKDI